MSEKLTEDQKKVINDPITAHAMLELLLEDGLKLKMINSKTGEEKIIKNNDLTHEERKLVLANFTKAIYERDKKDQND